MRNEGVPAPVAAVAAALVEAAAALLLATTASKPGHDSMPSFIPSWFTAKDSQWSVRSVADREKRWQRETPAQGGMAEKERRTKKRGEEGGAGDVR